MSDAGLRAPVVVSAVLAGLLVVLLAMVGENHALRTENAALTQMVSDAAALSPCQPIQESFKWLK